MVVTPVMVEVVTVVVCLLVRCAVVVVVVVVVVGTAVADEVVTVDEVAVDERTEVTVVMAVLRSTKMLPKPLAMTSTIAVSKKEAASNSVAIRRAAVDRCLRANSEMTEAALGF